MNSRAIALGAALAGYAAYAAYAPPPDKAPPAKPATPIVKPAPAPKPVDPDCPDGKCPPKRPKPPRRPWGERRTPVGVPARTDLVWTRWEGTREFALTSGGRQVGSYDAGSGVFRALLPDGTWGPKSPLPPGFPPPEDAHGGPVSPDGTEVQCEVPVEFRTRNIGSRVDGAGMCVTTATSVGAKWAGLEAWVGIRDWAAQFPGGSMPDKHLAQLKKYGEEKNLGVAPWAQYVGRDPAPFLDAVLGTGRVAAVSWMNGGHWLNLVHLDAKSACIMDNNGDPNNLQWMTRESALRQINSPYAWVGCWLPPGPPPPPKNPGTPSPQFRFRPAAGPAPATGGCDAPGVFLTDHLVGDGYTVRGKSSTLEELKAALGSPADLRLTVIGDAGAVAGHLAAHPALAPLKSGLQVQLYPADHWAVKGLGFVTGGAPTIYLQSADGTVLHRQDGYTGPDDLALAIRKARPDYRPDADPNLSNPLSGPGGSPDGLPLVLLGGAAAVVAYLRTRK
jgi:hypothetical protein